MRLFKFLSLVWLLAFFLLACAKAPKGEAVAVNYEEQQIALASQFEAPEFPEPKGAAGKASWAEVKEAMQSYEEDPLTAIYHFDLALGELYSEQRQDSLGLPEDSMYYSTMPLQIVLYMESLYPRLMDLTHSEHAHSMLRDYEIFESLESFEEMPLDSAEIRTIESHFGEMDLSTFSLPIEINDRVMQEIHFLTVSVRSFTKASLSRKTAVDSMIYAKLKERGMPADLIYLALAESGFKFNAYSKAKAAGLWQFIPATGKRYGLPSDFWLDMRYNPESATDAALSYLSDLHKEFNDWYLAMAAYNCGEGRIRRLVREKRAEDPSAKVSYWDLELPKETMHYVPRIIAAAIIGHYPEHYSIEIEPQSRAPYDTVTVQDCIPLDKVGGAVGTSANAIRDLNPELVRWCTPPNLKKYTMKVPQGTREKFLQAYAKMDKTQLVRWQQYKVQKGDNLGSISRLFGIKVADIQAANNLKNTKLKNGQVLIIPMPAGSKLSSKSEAIVTKKDSKAVSSNNDNIGNNVKTYVVRKGDNLGSISRRYGVSSQSLIAWNNLDGNKISIGQKLYLQEPSKKDVKKKEETFAQNNRGTNYEIKSGDNLWDIARNHNVTVQQLLDWNPGLDKKIYPGMKIKVGE
ncbi:MAG: LysM peptidoglycan-binding domain-containing protein [Fibromonadales bacterium]|nr:LysM peptidoglycan-binding domain-containing protein [Fibromonadales bacterium]